MTSSTVREHHDGKNLMGSIRARLDGAERRLLAAGAAGVRTRSRKAALTPPPERRAYAAQGW